MALCELCPLRDICEKIETAQDVTGYGSEIDPDTRAVLDAAKTIFAIEAKEDARFADPCKDRMPKVERFLLDAIGSLEEWGYILVCSDRHREALIDYVASFGENYGVANLAYTEEEFSERFPLLSLLERFGEGEQGD